jgi:hypothetical protein
MWEKIDQEIGTVFLSAEKALHTPTKKGHKWSPALAKAGLAKRHWKTRLTQAQAGTLPKAPPHGSYTIQDDCTLDLEILQKRYDEATKVFESIVHRHPAKGGSFDSTKNPSIGIC